MCKCASVPGVSCVYMSIQIKTSLIWILMATWNQAHHCETAEDTSHRNYWVHLAAKSEMLWFCKVISSITSLQFLRSLDIAISCARHLWCKCSSTDPILSNSSCVNTSCPFGLLFINMLVVLTSLTRFWIVFLWESWIAKTFFWIFWHLLVDYTS